MLCYIYLDVYYLFNVVMDFVVLWILCMWEREGKRLWYCFIAANVGGFYAVALLMIEIPFLAQWVLTYLVMGQVLVGISLKWRGIQRHISRVLSLYIGMFFLCGVLVVIADLQGSQREIYRTTGVTGVVNGKLCVGLVIVIGMIFYCLVNRGKQNWQIRKNVSEVEVVVEGKKKNVLALSDTGNCLVEPLTGKGACVLSADVIDNINIEKIIFIPYNTIDQNHGIMQGFWAEQLKVRGRIFEKVPVAIHQGQWGKRGEYEMILHPNYFEEGGVAYDCRKRKGVLDRKMESV